MRYHRWFGLSLYPFYPLLDKLNRLLVVVFSLGFSFNSSLISKSNKPYVEDLVCYIQISSTNRVPVSVT